MIFILCALKCEATPLTAGLGLDPYEKEVKFFQNGNKILLVSGTGEQRIRKAVAITRNLSKNSDDIYINIGVCGCRDENVRPGTSFLINEIVPADSGLPHYPDILVNHPFEEAGITMFGRPSSKLDFNTLLADMESHAFFSACLGHTTSNNIHMIKIVSDTMNPRHVTKEMISSAVRLNLELITEYISRLESLPKSGDGFVYSDYFNRYRFTETIKSELVKLNRYYFLKNGTEPGNEAYSGFAQPENKIESMEIYNEIKKRLV